MYLLLIMQLLLLISFLGIILLLCIPSLALGLTPPSMTHESIIGTPLCLYITSHADSWSHYGTHQVSYVGMIHTSSIDSLINGAFSTSSRSMYTNLGLIGESFSFLSYSINVGDTSWTSLCWHYTLSKGKMYTSLTW